MHAFIIGMHEGSKIKIELHAALPSITSVVPEWTPPPPPPLLPCLRLLLSIDGTHVHCHTACSRIYSNDERDERITKV